MKILALICIMLADMAFSKTINVYTKYIPTIRHTKGKLPELDGFTVEVLNRAFGKAGYKTKYYVSPYKRAVKSFKENKKLYYYRTFIQYF